MGFAPDKQGNTRNPRFPLHHGALGVLYAGPNTVLSETMPCSETVAPPREMLHEFDHESDLWEQACQGIYADPL